MGSRNRAPVDPATGVALRAARQARGITLRQFAQRLQISPATVSLIETGKSDITVARLTDFASALDLDVSDLLHGRISDSATPATGGFDVSGPSLSSGSEWRRYEPLHLSPILQAALDEIISVGYHGTSMRAIAGRCGMSVAAIYNHYNSKQQLLLSIFDKMMGELESRNTAALAAASGDVERFTNLVESFALFHTNRRTLGFVGATEMRALETPNRASVTKRRNHQQAVMDGIVSDGRRDGLFEVTQTHAASHAVVTMCIALSSWWQPGGPLTASEIARHYAAFALDLVKYTG